MNSLIRDLGVVGNLVPRALALALLPLLCGCSTTATISRISGGSVDAEIQRSDRDGVYVSTNTGRKFRVPRSDISDIDHPGNAVAVVGSALSVYGIINIASGMETCGRLSGTTYGTAYCGGTFAPAVLGVSMLTWGLMTWTKSTEAAGNLMPPPYDSVPSAPPASAFDVSSSTQQNKAHSSRERARTGGFQNTRWGMSPEQVRNLYADVEASSPDILSTKRPLAGHPATVRFGFLGGQLMQVHLELVRSETTNPPSDVFGHFKALLGQKYGQPLTQGDRSVTWSAEGSTIELLAPGEEGMPVKLVYMRGNDMNTVTKDL